ncbi:hypothetical protein [Streptomyces sp. JJ36]|uniref:hypothetical protein n=1 Tax=Streptomyces sp. JJ36 TaxID=2736645 RepID=UPI001F435FD5|nr:hypothetical protein [Streptomyces sp. JJ36]
MQEIAQDLVHKTNIPAVRDQVTLLEAVAGEEWWRDVTVPMLEHMRRSLRGLVRLVDDKAKRRVVYTEFDDELGPVTEQELRGVPQGTDEERFGRRPAPTCSPTRTSPPYTSSIPTSRSPLST